MKGKIMLFSHRRFYFTYVLLIFLKLSLLVKSQKIYLSKNTSYITEAIEDKSKKKDRDNYVSKKFLSIKDVSRKTENSNDEYKNNDNNEGEAKKSDKEIDISKQSNKRKDLLEKSVKGKDNDKKTDTEKDETKEKLKDKDETKKKEITEDYEKKNKRKDEYEEKDKSKEDKKDKSKEDKKDKSKEDKKDKNNDGEKTVKNEDESKKNEKIKNDEKKDKEKDDEKKDKEKDDEKKDKEKDDEKKDKDKDDEKKDKDKDDERQDKEKDDKKKDKEKDDEKKDENKNDEKKDKNKNDEKKDKSKDNKKKDKNEDDKNTDKNKDDKNTDKSKDDKNTDKNKDDEKKDKNKDDKKKDKNKDDEKKDKNKDDENKDKNEDKKKKDKNKDDEKKDKKENYKENDKQKDDEKKDKKENYKENDKNKDNKKTDKKKDDEKEDKIEDDKNIDKNKDITKKTPKKKEDSMKTGTKKNRSKKTDKKKGKSKKFRETDRKDIPEKKNIEKATFNVPETSKDDTAIQSGNVVFEVLVKVKNKKGIDFASVQSEKVNTQIDRFGVMGLTVTEEEMKKLLDNPNIDMVEKDEKLYALGEKENNNNEAVQTLSEETPWGISKVLEDIGFWKNLPEPPGSIKICVADTGYDLGHVDLPRAPHVNGSDSIANGKWSEDGHGHGTHCSGTIAAIGGNSKGVVGVIPDDLNGKFQLVIGKALNSQGSGNNAGVFEAIESCVNNGAKIISMSLGGSAYSAILDTSYRELYEEEGILLIAAAGNDGTNAYSYPASYSSMMSVAAIDSGEKKASFSQFNDQVEISAPGKGVKSTIPNNKYVSWDGTSMATPHVAAVAGLLWMYFPECENYHIRNVLVKTARDIDSNGCDTNTGFGLVQAKAAYDLLSEGNCGGEFGHRKAVGGCTHLNVCESDVECDDQISCTLDQCINRHCENKEMSCDQCGAPVKLNILITTDQYPEETSWEIRRFQDSALIGSGGPYSSKNHVHSTILCGQYESYYFVIYDNPYSDGICCEYGAGSFSVKANDVEVVSGDRFGALDKTYFQLCATDSDCQKESPCSICLSGVCQVGETSCANCPGAFELSITVTTDKFPLETSWDLRRQENNKLILADGPFGEKQQSIVRSKCLWPDSYIFTIRDSSGDGICCGFGMGSYSISVDGNVIKSGSSFTNTEETSFAVSNSNSPSENTFEIITSSPSYYPSFSPSTTPSISPMRLSSLFPTNEFSLVPSLGSSSFFSHIPTAIQILDTSQTPSSTLSSLSPSTTPSLFSTQEFSSPLSVTPSHFSSDLTTGKPTLVTSQSPSNVISSTPSQPPSVISSDILTVKPTLATSQALIKQTVSMSKSPFSVISTSPSDTTLNNPTSSVLITSTKNPAEMTLTPSSHHSLSANFTTSSQAPSLISRKGYSMSPSVDSSHFSSDLPTGKQILATSQSPSTFISSFSSQPPSFKSTDLLTVKPTLVTSQSPSGVQSTSPSKLLFYDPSDTFVVEPSMTVSKSPLSAISTSPSEITLNNPLEATLKPTSLYSYIANFTIPSYQPSQILSANPAGDEAVKKDNISHHEEAIAGETTSESWKIVVDSVSAIELDQGIDIEYFVSKNLHPDQFAAIIYDKTCSNICNNASISVTGYDFEVKNNETMDKAIVKVGIDYSSIRASQFWSNISLTSGAYEFCVVSEMYFDNSQVDAITMTETMISSLVDFEGNFNITDVHVSKSDAFDLHEGTKFQLEACLCNEGHVCDSAPMIHQDSDIIICVHPHHELRVSKFQTVNFYQDGILKFKAVENGEGKLLTTTAIEGEYGVLKTRLVADFFRTPNPSAAHVTGEVFLDFRDHISGRSLLENQQAVFNINISLEQKSTSSTHWNSLSLIVLTACACYVVYKRKKKNNDKYISYSLVETNEMY